MQFKVIKLQLEFYKKNSVHFLQRNSAISVSLVAQSWERVSAKARWATIGRTISPNFSPIVFSLLISAFQFKNITFLTTRSNVFANKLHISEKFNSNIFRDTLQAQAFVKKINAEFFLISLWEKWSFDKFQFPTEM